MTKDEINNAAINMMEEQRKSDKLLIDSYTRLNDVYCELWKHFADKVTTLEESFKMEEEKAQFNQAKAIALTKQMKEARKHNNLIDIKDILAQDWEDYL